MLRIRGSGKSFLSLIAFRVQDWFYKVVYITRMKIKIYKKVTISNTNPIIKYYVTNP